MMNQTSSSTRKSPIRPDNSYKEDLNDNNLITSMQNLRMSQENTEYSEEYLSNSMLFEGYNDNDDEVFEEFQESSTITISREPRIRRISDVIDSIGCSPSSPVSKTSNNFDFTERALTETEERSICIVRRETEVKYRPIHLENPPVRRAMSSVTDSLASPPPTPGSDPGYCSASLATPPPLSNLVFKPKWFRYSGSSPPKIDTMDAQVMCAPEEEQQMKPTTTGPASVVGGGGGGVTPLIYPQAEMPVPLSSFEYNMGHARRGHAIIFNHEEFTMDNTAPRVGSKLDAIRLQTTLEGLGFTVQTYHDLDSDKIKAKINELASLDHSDCDCVLVAVLSHGMGTSYILSHDYPYPVDMLWSPFIPDRCPTLAGKPKLFLIQACRGDKLDGGVQLVKRTQVDSDSGSQTYKIPAMADFLIAYSTAEGFYSWRNPLKGTWFIQSLCEILEKQAFLHDVQTLLLMVSHKVALEHESFSDIYPWQHQQKQVPQTVSTLIRKIYFKPKA